MSLKYLVALKEADNKRSKLMLVLWFTIFLKRSLSVRFPTIGVSSEFLALGDCRLFTSCSEVMKYHTLCL